MIGGGVWHDLCSRAGMRYQALALDYDGTLATDGVVPGTVVDSLRQVRASGRRLIMVTGRELPDLLAVFAFTNIFDCIVAENGGLLYVPSTGRQVPLATPPPPSLVAQLRQRGVPISVGAVIIALQESDWPATKEVLASAGFAVDVVLNKGSLMLLPASVNKGTGLARAAYELGIDRQSIVAMGDGENDHSLLRACGLGLAVANAVPQLKIQADAVTHGARGDGVIEVIGQLLATDLAGMTARPREAVAVPASDAEALTTRTI